MNKFAEDGIDYVQYYKEIAAQEDQTFFREAEMIYRTLYEDGTPQTHKQYKRHMKRILIKPKILD